LDEFDYQRETTREIQQESIARRVLGVAEDASPDQIRRAWRRACLRTHPDRNPGNAEARKKFRIVNGAYRLLTTGSPCDELMSVADDAAKVSGDDEAKRGGAWRFFLWWRETFF